MIADEPRDQAKTCCEAGQQARSQARDAVLTANDLGTACLESARYGEALGHFARALAAVPSAELCVREVGQLYTRVARCHFGLGSFEDARSWCQRARTLGRAEGDRAASVEAEVVLAKLESACGRPEAAIRCAQAAYDVLREKPESSLLAEAANALGTASAENGDVEAARLHFTESSVICRRLGDDAGLADAYGKLGVLAKRTGEMSSALRCHESALGIDERLGRAARVSLRLVNLGILLFRLSRWDEAEERLNEAEEICLRIGAARRLVAVRGVLGNLARGRGDWARAEELFDEVLRKSREAGYLRAEALALEFRGELEADRGEYATAIRTLDQALAAAKRLAAKSDVIHEVLRRRAEVLLALGRVGEAERDARDALARARDLGDRLEEGSALRAAAAVSFARGETEEAERLISEAEAILRSVGESFELARCALVEGIGLTASASGEGVPIDRIDARLLTASALFSEIGAAPWAGRCDLAKGRAFLRVGQLDRSRACLERGRATLDATGDEHGLAAIRAALGEVDERMAAEAAVPNGRRYDLMARWCESADTPALDLVDLHLRATEVARMVSADRLVLLAASDGDRFVVATAVDLTGHGASASSRFAQELADAKHPHATVVLTRDSRGSGLPCGIDAAVFVPVTPEPPVTGRYVLYVDRDRSSGTAAFAHRDVAFLAAASTHLAAIHSRIGNGSGAETRAGPVVELECDHCCPALIARDPRMLEIIDDIARLQNSRVPVLITGESGVGKEVVARAIHRGGRSESGDFVALNAGAVAPHLQESELFGHVKGAFTDAHRDREGLIAAAAGGTLFLDEVAEMSNVLQVKLLRFLQDGEYRRVGESRSRTSDARIISATNKDLSAEVKAGRFRKDLLYRLRTFVVDVPPLRDRPGDVEPLMEHFLELHAGREGKRIAGFSREVRGIFLRHDWRENNVRELENEIRRAVAVCGNGDTIGTGVITPALLARYQDRPLSRRGPTLKEETEAFEKRLILEALEACAWNKKRAAEELGCSRTGLLTKMRKHAVG